MLVMGWLLMLVRLLPMVISCSVVMMVRFSLMVKGRLSVMLMSSVSAVVVMVMFCVFAW